MNIFLDNIIFSLQHTGGISVYWSSLIKEVRQQEAVVTCVERPDALLNIQRRGLALPQTSIGRDLQLPLQIARYLPVSLPKIPRTAVFHSSYYRPVIARDAAAVVTVYDFIYEQYRSGIKRLVHTCQKRAALQQAEIIICISENTRKDLLRFYPGIKEERLRVVPLSAGENYHLLPEPPRQQKDTILFVGDRSHYKNFPVAIETVARLSGKNLRIIGGGVLSPEERQLLDVNLPGRYQHSQNVSDMELNLLYNTAYCLLYPSSYEGFGIPPLEAMQAGCPVVATRVSSLPEVCGDGALLADMPTSENFLVLLKQLEKTNIRETVQARGFRQASRFSWKRTCRETLTCYQDALESFARYTRQ